MLDNALDAAEATTPNPEISLALAPADGLVRVTVTDNGPGMPAEVVEQLLDFGNNVSDKASYRSPTRGLQGNAFKTLIGIPYALGVAEPLVIEAHGTRHEVGASLDPGGNVVIRHDTSPSTRTVGTAVTVPLPAGLIRAEDAGR
ncbi:ATP-binding protein [Streptacidiphilus sp. P02-A3a]|uniref:ATP-binding protein n=1 Tax=Streptacidiphilus sp. P02-A3a TaxID=2704468 RepID=UPI001CDC8708|nr:ATP-binding protein [Streptacidiphilus sp. P02-A3a]